MSDVVEAMARAIWEANDPYCPFDMIPDFLKAAYRIKAGAALAAVAPLIAAQERERCAELAETHEWFVGGIGTKAPGSGEAKAIAAAIRALGDAT